MCGFMLLLIIPKRSGLVMTAPFFFLDSINPIIRRRSNASLTTVRLTPSVSASSTSLGILSPTFSFFFCKISTSFFSTLSTSVLVSIVWRLFLNKAEFIMCWLKKNHSKVYVNIRKKNFIKKIKFFFGQFKSSIYFYYVKHNTNKLLNLSEMKFSYLKIGMLLSCFLLSAASWAQVKKVSGTVISDLDGKPLAGVSIIIKKSGVGTQSNAEGQFTIAASTGDVLTFSYTGFKDEDVKVEKSSELTVELH